MRIRYRLLFLCVGWVLCTCMPRQPRRIPRRPPIDPGGNSLPRALPFTAARDHDGSGALSAREIDAFTERFIGFVRDRDYFRWVLRTSHGMDPRVNPHSFAVWWNGFDVHRRGDTVAFRADAGRSPDNIMIPTAKVLGQAAAAYLLTTDSAAGQVVIRYCRGVRAQFQGMVWDSTDTARLVLARVILPRSHWARTEEGMRKYIDYSAWRKPIAQWNTRTIRVPDNPYWDSLWVRTMRSKDDLPHLFRAAVWLLYVAERGRDSTVRAVAASTYGLLSRFAASVAHDGYRIATRDSTGRVYVPTADLAGFNNYDVLSPLGECTAKLTVALLGTGRPLGNCCGDAFGTLYGTFAPRRHYYNLAIVRGFHMTAVLTALLHGRDRRARRMIEGLALRARNVFAIPPEHYDVRRRQWEADGAVFLVQAAACGLPLTPKEMRFVQQQYGSALDYYDRWQYWDPWADTLSDGMYPYRPHHPLRLEDIGFIFEYCFSPFGSRANGGCIDCERVRRLVSEGDAGMMP